MLKKKQPHWTEGSSDDFRYRIASDFAEQIRDRLREKKWSQAKLARATGLDKSHISQLLNNPGNLGLEMIIKLARAVELKVAVVAYDDLDTSNKQGPINAEIFRMCWERVGRPTDLWDYKEMMTQATIGADRREYKGGFVYDDNDLVNIRHADRIAHSYLGQASFSDFRFGLGSAVNSPTSLMSQ